jgi:hypothetical protein
MTKCLFDFVCNGSCWCTATAWLHTLPEKIVVVDLRRLVENFASLSFDQVFEILVGSPLMQIEVSTQTNRFLVLSI